MTEQLSLFEAHCVKPQPVRRFDPAGGSVKDDEYNTPQWIWQLGLDVFGVEEYDLDPATNESSTVPAYQKFMLWDDGLSRSWRVPGRDVTRIWLNPPFSRNADFIEKLCLEYERGGIEAIVLDKHDHRVEWWWQLQCVASGLCLIRGYVRFDGQSQSYRFPVSMFYLGSDYAAFEQMFCGFGLVVGL